MKIKSKLILAATSMLVLSGVAAGTSTFAWYTANRQVELGVTNVGATAQLTTLNMTYLPEKNTRNTPETGVDPMVGSVTDSAFTGSFSKDLTDVSSIGDHSFIKPIWKASVDTTTNTGEAAGFWSNEADYQTDQNAGDSVFYHQLVFTFDATGANVVDLYLSPKSTVTENTSGASNLLEVADAVRLSLSSKSGADGSTEAQMIYANPNGNDENTYLADTADTTAETISADPGFAVVEDDVFFARATNYTEAELYYGNGASALTKYDDVKTGFLAQIDPVVSTTVDVTVDMWIEGTDADCEDLDDADFEGIFDTSLEFYTLNHSGMTNTGV